MRGYRVWMDNWHLEHPTATSCQVMDDGCLSVSETSSHSGPEVIAIYAPGVWKSAHVLLELNNDDDA